MKTYSSFLLSFAFSTVVFVVLCVVAASCRSDSLHSLESVESAIADRPDEALFILAKIDTAGLSVADKAQMVYLRTRASAKAGLPVTWPDEMCEAAEILSERTSDLNELSMAYYYAGYACFENNRLADAVREYRKCERVLGDVLTSPLFKHLQNALFRCYYSQSLYKDAIACLELNLRAAEVQRDTIEIVDIKNAIAHIYMIQENYDSAWHYYSDSQYLLAVYSHKEPESLSRCYNGKSTVLCQQGMLAECLLYNDTAMSVSVDQRQYYAMCLNRGACYQKMGMTDSADYYFNLTLSSTNIELRNNVYYRLYDLHKSIGNDSMATIYADSSLYYQQLVDVQQQIDDIKLSDEKHLMELHEEALQREQNRFWVTNCFVLFVFAVLSGCLIWSQNRKKVQQSSSTENNSSMIPESLITALETSKQVFEQTPAYSILQEFLQFKDRKSNVREQENCHTGLKEVLTPVFLELKAIDHNITVDDSIFLFLCYMKISSCILQRYLGTTNRALIQRKHRLKNKLPPNFCEFFFVNYK